MDPSRYLTQRHPPNDDGGIIVVATMMFEGKEAMYPGCLMYHRAEPTTPQRLDPPRKRSAAEMDDPLDPITSKFWVTSLASDATMGGRDDAVVAGICISEPPRHAEGPAQLALMISGVATIKLSTPLTPDPAPGELIRVNHTPDSGHTLRTSRFLPPSLRFLIHWPPHIKSADVFDGTGTDQFGALLGAVGDTERSDIRDFGEQDSRNIASAAKYLAFMAGESVSPDDVYTYLNSVKDESPSGLEPYLHPFGAFARVLDSGPNGTLRVLLKGMI